MMQEKTRRSLDIGFFLALLFKVFGAGFSYFCTLDDYIQYGCYPLYHNLFHVLFERGSASTRPLAAVLDPTVWGVFFPNMAFALLLMTGLHFLSAKYFDKCMRKCNITITPFFYLVYLLLPLNFEGTYWISASSRIVVGLFFTSLALVWLIRYENHEKKKNLSLYILFALLSFGFYESVIVLSGLLQVLLIVKSAVEKKERKRLILLAIPFFCALLVLVYYKVAAVLSPAVRTTAFSLENLGDRAGALISQLVYIFTAGLYRTTLVGVIDGIKALWQAGYLGGAISIFILGIAAACGHFGGKIKLSSPSARLCIPLGIFMILLPLLPNMLVPDVWLTYRSIVVCLPGLCILFAPLLARLMQNKTVSTVTIFVAVTLFLTGCYNELCTYKKVNEIDQKIAKQVVAKLESAVLVAQKPVILVFEKEVALPQTSPYKDHVKSAFYVDWAATGIIRATARNVTIESVTPVYSLENIDTTNAQILYIDKFYHVTEEHHE